MHYILDACALITLINREEGWDRVNDLFYLANSGEIVLYMSIVNMIEVFYNYIRSDGIENAFNILNSVYETPLIIIDRISPAVFQESAHLKAIYKRISIADVIGLATAKELSATFITSDHHEMDIIEQNENIQFLWIR